jgi:hypothetical protein
MTEIEALREVEKAARALNALLTREPVVMVTPTPPTKGAP